MTRDSHEFGNTYYSPWQRHTARAATFAAAAALCGCALPSPQNPQPLPGERIGIVRIITSPPGLAVRLTSQVSARPGVNVEQPGQPNQSGPSPLEVSVSYKPGTGTQMVVKGFLSEAPAPNQVVDLGCEVWAGDVHLHDLDDKITVDEHNMQTAFVLCNFNEFFAPGG